MHQAKLDAIEPLETTKAVSPVHTRNVVGETSVVGETFVVKC